MGEINRQPAGGAHRAEPERLASGIHRAGRFGHRDPVRQSRFHLRHLQLPGKPGADGNAAAHAAG